LCTYAAGTVCAANVIHSMGVGDPPACNAGPSRVLINRSCASRESQTSTRENPHSLSRLRREQFWDALQDQHDAIAAHGLH
jgi:hypothetical protein